jgi:hypothetical protein
MNAIRQRRDVRLDALRGLFLLIMTGVHVPAHMSRLFQDPLGCAGAAEGFIFLSACLAGLVFGRLYAASDWTQLRRRIRQRALLIYTVHLLVLLPTVLTAWALAARVPPLAVHFSNFLAHPWGSLALMPLLLHQPPLFDILPLYVIFLALTPWLLAFARRHGWPRLLLASGLVWLAVQCKLEAHLPANPLAGLPLRWGSFDLFAWQFLWVGGVALGETARRQSVIPARLRLPLGLTAAGVVLLGLILRHGYWPPQWWNNHWFLWMNKWTLGPLRLLDFAAWAALLLAWNPHPPARPLAPLALLGRHSLAVFALVIAAGVFIQVTMLSYEWQNGLSYLIFALLFLWAAALDRRKRNAARAAV